MHRKFCPNCGHRLKPGQTFCGHCGYNLKTHQVAGSQSAASGMAHRPARPMYNRPPMPPRRSNAGIVIIVILLLVILGVGGYYTYTHIIEGGPRTAQQQNQQNGNSNSNGNTSTSNNSSSQSSAKIPQSTAMNILSKTFGDAEDMVNNGDDDGMSQYFVNGDSNKDYHILHDWADDQHHSESLDSVDMGVASVSGVTAGSGGASKVACHVKYQFHYDSDTKHQTFIWYAQFKKVGGSWKLASLKADNNPISNH